MNPHHPPKGCTRPARLRSLRLVCGSVPSSDEEGVHVIRLAVIGHSPASRVGGDKEVGLVTKPSSSRQLFVSSDSAIAL
jgi:hypothetical protein